MSLLAPDADAPPRLSHATPPAAARHAHGSPAPAPEHPAELAWTCDLFQLTSRPSGKRSPRIATRRSTSHTAPHARQGPRHRSSPIESRFGTFTGQGVHRPRPEHSRFRSPEGIVAAMGGVPPSRGKQDTPGCCSDRTPAVSRALTTLPLRRRPSHTIAGHTAGGQHSVAAGRTRLLLLNAVASSTLPQLDQGSTLTESSHAALVTYG